MLRLSIVATLISTVVGHGYMTNPKIRGIGGSWSHPPVDTYKTEPQSGGATGSRSDIPVCGRSNGGFQKRRKHDPVTKLTPGSDYTFSAKITAHHMGHMTLRVCPLIDKRTRYSDMKNCHVVQGKELSTKSKKLAPFWFLTPRTGDKKWTGVLPTLAELKKLNSPTGVFTVQWRWNTANSCVVHRGAYSCAMQGGIVTKDMCFGECYPSPAWGKKMECPANIDLYDRGCDDKNCCSEVFTNCADVVFDGIKADIDATLDGGSGDDGPDEPEPEPEPEAEDESGGGGGAGCMINKDCKKNLWCRDKTYVGWCPKHKSEDLCPTPQCKWGSSRPGPKPKPTPKPKPGSKPRPRPKPVKHEIIPGAGVENTELDMDSVKRFCIANKDVLCGENTHSVTVDTMQLCDCHPDNSEKPTPEPEPEPPAPSPLPGTPAPPSPPGKELPCDNGRGSCKDLCSKKCGYKVKTNQCWGSPRYIECRCSNKQLHFIKGCTCKNGGCKRLKAEAGLLEVDGHVSDSADVGEADGHASTKFSGRIHRAVSANGEISEA